MKFIRTRFKHFYGAGNRNLPDLPFGYDYIERDGEWVTARARSDKSLWLVSTDRQFTLLRRCRLATVADLITGTSRRIGCLIIGSTTFTIPYTGRKIL